MNFVLQEKERAQRIVRHIQATALPGETPNARLQLIAVAVVIAILQKNGGPVTIHMLAELLGFTASRMGKLVLRLVDRGLVKREKIHNRRGNGYAYAVRLRETSEIEAHQFDDPT